MKRKDFLTLSTLTPLAVGFLAQPGKAAQRGQLANALGRDELVRPTKTKGSAADIKELKESKSDRFDLSSLSSSDRQGAIQISEATVALLTKVLLSRKDPGAYPLSKEARSLEQLADSLVEPLAPKTLARFESALKTPARLKKGLGSLSGLDLKTELTQSTLRLPASVLKRGSLGPEKPSGEPLPAACDTAVQGYNRLDLTLRRLHCIEETSPKGGTDDMVLGGLLIGASGNVAKMKGVVCGEFEGGELSNYGELPLGFYNLNSTPGYPKTFYAIFMLVESDSDDAEVARNLTSALKTVATLVVGAFAGASTGVLVGAIIDAIGKFIGMFFDEDYFPAYGVRLTLNSPNQFGGSDSPALRTEDIRGHGGTYRIGYRWHLASA
ncbi:hypothetical protein [Armatimonas rosea]|uniref:Uncharacterized protein n=1 Tax=Armatimonas rosea TaxID=685828 RepID=A0A7W9SKN2_ARMRO|nr:hypothetical protein [Armatimonas rosea]MBB6048366.1 hypothetical protein [Armatimonas rosea]